MHAGLLAELSATTHALLDILSKFTPEQFNTVPFEGSWTPGQVAEHLLKAESGMPHIWKGNTKKTERKDDEKAAIFRQVFLDFSTKLKSPDFILPSGEPKDKETICNALQHNRATIESLASTIDLSLTYTDFSMPQIGELTGVEGVTFIIVHSLRHIHQLKNIHQYFMQTAG